MLQPLYIDPGTGSLLFSIIITLTAAVYFVFRALLIRTKVFFSGGRSKHGTKNKFVIYAEDKRYFNLFKPIIDEFEKRNIDLLYLTSSQDDPVFEAGLKFTKPEYLGEGNKAFTRLNFLSADFVLATTPGLDVYQWKRSKLVKHYCHIPHSTDECSNYEMFALDYYDSVLVSGGCFQTNAIQKLEKARKLPAKQLITVGCPYLDEHYKKLSFLPKEENHIFTVLVSPSWGKSSLLLRYGETLLDPLVDTGWRIIVRPHPQSLIVENEVIERLSNKYKTVLNFEWDFERENIYSLSKADFMISDFSGIILDYLFLFNKPAIYVSQKMDLRPLDAHSIYEDQEEMWLFKTLKKTCVELKPEFFADLKNIVSNIVGDSSIKSAINKAKEEAWHFQGEAGQRVAEFMIKTAQ